MVGWRNRSQYQTIDDEYDDYAASHGNNPLLPTTPSRLRYTEPIDHNAPSTSMSASNLEQGYQYPPREHRSSSDPLLNATGGASLMPQAMCRSSNDCKWEHIENLDQFFTRVYEYHQGGGYICIATKHILNLLQFIFIVVFSTFFLQCIDYNFLFRNTNVTTSGTILPLGAKRHFNDAIVKDCASHFHPFVVIALVMAVIFWSYRVIRACYYLLQLREIQDFYQCAIGISDSQLSNLTWHAIVKRICEVQPKLHLIVNLETISPLDLYHRILRFKNYFVAMVNQNLLPPVLKIPLFGDVPYLSNGLKANLEWLLFWGSFSPWKGPYVLREEYRELQNTDYLTLEMEKTVLYLGIFNLVFFPLVFLYQLLYSFFTFTEMIKREPSSISTRKYSNYGRYRLRHFNELEHELRARLNRSHAYASAYVNQFYSPLGELFAKNIAFIAGAIFGVLAVLSAWDEDVLQVEHVLTAMTIAGVALIFCRGLISDENLVWQPEILLNHVASELHYIPADWKGKAHTDQVLHSFQKLFKLKVFHLLEELSSPIVTPYLLLFHVKPACKDLVRFLIEYSEGVDGLGNVCSFALMDVAKHGDPTWDVNEEDEDQATQQKGAMPARNGKTELSILHFNSTNPEWKPPAGSEQFIRRFRHRMERDAASLRSTAPGPNVLLDSVTSLLAPLQQMPGHQGALIGTGIHQIDGPLDGSQCMLANLSRSNPLVSSLTNSMRQNGFDVDSTSHDMRLQAMYMRELHSESLRQSTHRPNYNSIAGPSASIFGVPQMSEFVDSTGERFGGTSVLGRSMNRSTRSQQNQPFALPTQGQAVLPFGALGQLIEQEDEVERSHENGNLRSTLPQPPSDDENHDEDASPPAFFST